MSIGKSPKTRGFNRKVIRKWQKSKVSTGKWWKGRDSNKEVISKWQKVEVRRRKWSESKRKWRFQQESGETLLTAAFVSTLALLTFPTAGPNPYPRKLPVKPPLRKGGFSSRVENFPEHLAYRSASSHEISCQCLAKEIQWMGQTIIVQIDVRTNGHEISQLRNVPQHCLSVAVASQPVLDKLFGKRDSVLLLLLPWGGPYHGGVATNLQNPPKPKPKQKTPQILRPSYSFDSWWANPSRAELPRGSSALAVWLGGSFGVCFGLLVGSVCFGFLDCFGLVWFAWGGRK